MAINRTSAIALGVTAVVVTGVVAVVLIERRKTAAAPAPAPGTPTGATQVPEAPSDRAFRSYDLAATRGLPVATQQVLWQQFINALRAEGKAIPPTPAFVAAPRSIGYCSVEGGCTILPATSGAPAYTVPYGAAVALTDVDTGAPRRAVQYPVTPLGSARRVTGSIDRTQLSNLAPPASLTVIINAVARARNLIMKAKQSVASITPSEAQEMASLAPTLRAAGPYGFEADSLEELLRIRTSYLNSISAPGGVGLNPPGSPCGANTRWVSWDSPEAARIENLPYAGMTDSAGNKGSCIPA